MIQLNGSTVKIQNFHYLRASLNIWLNTKYNHCSLVLVIMRLFVTFYLPGSNKALLIRNHIKGIFEIYSLGNAVSEGLKVFFDNVCKYIAQSINLIV